MSNTPAALPPKKDVARALLLRGSVFIHLDPRQHGVLVPARLRNQPQVVLQVGLNMPVPITDLRVDDEGVYGTLSFKGVPFTCYVPWHAVFALVGEDAKGMVWPKEMPTEVAAEIKRETERETRLTDPYIRPVKNPKAAARGWGVVDGGNTSGSLG